MASITPLEDFTEPTNEDGTGWQDYSYTGYRDYGAGYLRALLSYNGVYNTLKNSSNDNAVALIDSIAAGESLCVDPDIAVGELNRLALDKFKALDTEESTAFEKVQTAIYAYCEYEVSPYESVTQLQFNISNDVFTELIFDYPFGGLLEIEVSGCDERCNASTWFNNDSYDTTQNWGKSCHGLTKFVFNLGSDKSSDGKVIVKIPFENVTLVE